MSRGRCSSCGQPLPGDSYERRHGHPFDGQWHPDCRECRRIDDAERQRLGMPDPAISS